MAREVPVAIRLHARPRIAMRKDDFLTSPSACVLVGGLLFRPFHLLALQQVHEWWERQ